MTKHGLGALEAVETGDERDRRCPDLDRARAGGRVPAGRLPRRRDRHALQAVRDHDRHLRGDLGRSWRSPCRRRSPRSSSRPTTARRRASSAGSRMASQRLTDGYAGGVARLIRAGRSRSRPSARCIVGHRADVPHPAGQLRARRGPGLLLRDHRGARHREPGLPRAGWPTRHSRSSAADPAVQDVAAGQRLQPGGQPVPQQRGGHLRLAQALRGAQGPVPAELRRAAAPQQAVRRLQGGLRLRDQPAGDPGSGDDGRLRVLRPEPRLGRPARHRPDVAGLPGQGARSGPNSPASTRPSAPRRSSSSSSSTATGPRCWACRCRRPSRRCRASSARRSRASSASSAACGTWCCRPTRPVSRESGGLQQGQRPLATRGRWSRFRR